MPLVATKGAASAQGFGEFSQQTAANYIEDVFSTYLYTGNGSTQTITNDIDLAGKGGLVWIKGRSYAANNVLMDTVRGTSVRLKSNSTDGNETATTDVTSFNSNGFSLGGGGSTNASGGTICSWTFRKQAKFFDIVTYTGNGANRTIAHNLGSVPGCIIVKRTDAAGYGWPVYHRSIGASQALELQITNAAFASTTYWNSTAPTSAVFSIGTDSYVNASGGTYIAYIFAHDAGGFGTAGTDNVISCGSFTTDSSGKSTINLGYEPQWVMIKITNDASSWLMADNMRGVTATGDYQRLLANSSSAESAVTAVNINATGFSINQAAFASLNFIYMAIRRPMKPPTSGTEVFYPKVHAGVSSYSVGFPTDLCLAGDQSGNALNTLAVYRLAGNSAYFGGTASTAAEQIVSVCQFDLQNSFQLSYNSNNQARWHFRRASGFFDVVCYTGTGSATTQAHNLGVAPEMMIVKQRNGAGNWAVYHSALGNTKWIRLSDNYPASTASTIWNNTTPTSSVFTVGTSGTVNGSGNTYVAYLFATLAGVSKVGSYTGTAAAQTINCGFTGGARFVLIRRTDDWDGGNASGDWYVWDTARGIVSGNDPYLLLNSTAAEVTNTDYIDPVNSGFELSSTAPAAINANGGSFIFLAIA